MGVAGPGGHILRAGTGYGRFAARAAALPAHGSRVMTPGEFFGSVAPLFPGVEAVAHTLGLGVLAAVVLTPAERLAPAQRQPLVFRRGFALDLMYWFATPLLTRCITAAVLVGIFLLVAVCIGFERVPRDLLTGGFGPLARQPAWLQAIEILVLADFVDYWTHRGFHRGPLWRVHAIHHSPEEMNWISSSRVHPLNDLVTRSCQILPVLGLGFSAVSVMTVVPFVAFYVMFLHSNVRWDFGPLRWVLVSPAYHRWHHTTDAEGIDKNFAGIFPVWDLLFGTAHFPRRLPRRYGLVGYRLPDSMLAHLVFPFTGKGAAPRGPGPKAER